MGMRADEPGDDGLSGAVDYGRARRVCLRRRSDGLDQAAPERNVEMLSRRRAGSVDYCCVMKDYRLLRSGEYSR
jgi:hypothetical protein